MKLLITTTIHSLPDQYLMTVDHPGYKIFKIKRVKGEIKYLARPNSNTSGLGSNYLMSQLSRRNNQQFLVPERLHSQ